VFGEQRSEARDVALDEFGVERDGSERVLDLVRDAARDFFPCTLLLREQQLGGVFDHQDVADGFAVGSRAFEQCDGGREVQHAGAGGHLHLRGG
jgi:hypothetical protein